MRGLVEAAVVFLEMFNYAQIYPFLISVVGLFVLGFIV